MAEDFLRRWARLKREKIVEDKKQPAAAPVLPPIDKMTPDSDFTAFMQPKVEDALRRAALKKLFSDPRFNIPDPFEAYSGDWTGGEPIPEAMLATLNQARTLLFTENKEKTEEKPPQPEEKPKEDEPGRQDA
jgi:hypothetical protein